MDVVEMLEYQLIQKEYGERVAERSKVPLINHIDEGLAILDSIGANLLAKRAYCLHPLVQADEALIKFYHSEDSMAVSSRVLLLALEYRKVANAYLSHRKIKNISEIELSLIEEVNQMLYADKVQNQKDFLIYHRGKHSRSNELEKYFNNWLKKLEYLNP